MALFQGYISYAPFPEGFQGDMDETFQQSGQLAVIYINGNFLSGLYYPNGTTPPPTLPNSDQGPIALNGVWYFWDPVTGQYLPQTTPVNIGTNYCRNAVYQVHQAGSVFSLTAAQVYKTFDLVLSRVTQANILAIALGGGPAASADNDDIPTSIQYTVGPNLVSSLAATDLFVHEHLIEGSDIVMAQGQPLSLAFSVLATQAGTYSGYLASSSRDATYVFTFTIAQANKWARIKINNIPAMPVSGTGALGTWNFAEGVTGIYIGIGMGVGSQYRTTTPLQWLGGFFAGTSAVSGNFLAVLNNQMKITGIKLEANSVASYLTVRTFEDDLEDCHRYYWSSFDYQPTGIGVFLYGTSAQTGQITFSVLFPKRMCAVPSVIPYSYVNKTPGFVTDQTLGFDIVQATLTATKKGIAHQAQGSNLTINGNTHGTTTIDGMPNTTGVQVGMLVTGSGIQTGSTVVTVLANSITISIATTSTLTGTPLTFTFGTLILNGNTHNNTTIDGLATTADLAIGMEVSGGPAVPLNGNIYGNTTVDNLASTSSLAIGMAVVSPNFTINGNTHSNTTIDNLASTTGLFIGMLVSGSGVPSNTTVTAITSNSVTISNATTTSRTSIPITFNCGIAPGTTIAAITSSSAITLSAATTATIVGLPINFNSGIAIGTTITAIPGGGTITISLPAISSLTNVPFTFSFPVRGDTLLAYVTADARLT